MHMHELVLSIFRHHNQQIEVEPYRVLDTFLGGLKGYGKIEQKWDISGI
jgi:hypothetical protein